VEFSIKNHVNNKLGKFLFIRAGLCERLPHIRR